MTNRKLHACFPFVPKSMTLDDPKLPFRTLFQNTCVFGAFYENLNEDRPMLSAAKMERNMALVSAGLYRYSRAFLDEASFRTTVE